MAVVVPTIIFKVGPRRLKRSFRHAVIITIDCIVAPGKPHAIITKITTKITTIFFFIIIIIIIIVLVVVVVTAAAPAICPRLSPS